MTSVLHRLERLFRTDISYLVSGLGWLGSGEVVSNLLGFLQVVAFANLVAPGEYGSFQYVQSVYGLLSLLAWPGLQVAVARASARGHDGALVRGARWRFRWALLGALLGAGFGAYTIVRGNVALGLSIAGAALVLPVVESSSLYASFMAGRKLFRLRTIFNIAIQVVPLAVVIPLMVVAPRLPVLVLGYYLPLAVVHAVFYLSATRMPARTDIGEDAEMLHYGRSLSIFQGVTAVSIWADRFLLYHLLGPAPLAIFSVAMVFPRRVKGLLSIVGDLAFPKWAQKRAWEIRVSLPRKLLLETAGILVVCAVYALAAPLIFRVFFPAYRSAVPLSQVLILFSLIGLSYPIGAFLEAHKRVKELYVLHFGVFTIKIAAFVVLTPKFGLWGSVMATLLEAVANLAISLYLLFKEKSSEVYVPVPVRGQGDA